MNDREPQPGDGPQYHDDHVAWRSRQSSGPVPRIQTTTPRLRQAVRTAHDELLAEQSILGPARTISVDEWADRIIEHLGDDIYA